MKLWLVRADAPSVTVNSDKSITIRSKRTPRIKEGDKAVLLTKQEFAQWATVKDVEPLDEVTLDLRPSPEFDVPLEEPSKPGVKHFKVEVDTWVTIEGSLLADLLFSLTFIKNVHKPSLYLRRGYRSLHESDFTTIVQGDVFLARTAYFELLTALPSDTQLAFQVSQLLSGTSDAPFVDQLQQLQLFIDEQVLSIGRALVDLTERIERFDLRDEGGKRVKHFFSDETAEEALKNPDSGSLPLQRRFTSARFRRGDDPIGLQAARFEPLVRSSESQNVQGMTFDGLASDFRKAIAASGQQAIEERIQRAFKANR